MTLCLRFLLEHNPSKGHFGEEITGKMALIIFFVIILCQQNNI